MFILALMRRPGRHRIAKLLAGTMLVMLAVLGCDETDGDRDGQPTEPSPQLPLPELSLAVSYEPAVDDHVNAGEPIVFRVDLGNAGPGPADSVAVLIALPELTDLVETTASPGRFAAGTARWHVGRLDAGRSGHLTVNAMVHEGTVGEELVFTAHLEAAVPADTSDGDNQAMVRVGVVNHPPDADDDAYFLAEGAILSVPGPGVLGNDLDHGGEAIHLDLGPVDGPFRGALTLQGDGGFVYDHDGSEAPADSFRYRIDDASAESDTAMVRLEIVLANDRPVIVDLPGYTIAEGDTFAAIELDLLVHDDDHEDDQFVWQVLNADELTASLGDDDVLTVITPGSDWYGEEVLLFRVRDPEGAVADDEEITWTARGHEPMIVTISTARVLTFEPPNPSWSGDVAVTLRATDPEGGWGERTTRFEVRARR